MRILRHTARLQAGVLLSIGIALAAEPDVREIVRHSVENNNKSWNVAPQYSFTEADVIAKDGKTTRRTYRVSMIDGSPYQRVVAENGEPLAKARAGAEEQKLQQETTRRRAESSVSRQRRIAAYERERRQDHALMGEMVRAFDFQLAGQESVNGHNCYVITATPRPGYRPMNRDTKVLTGMRGKMWIDSREYQWVKVHAEVFRPVAFGLFIAHVQPGTEFTLEEAPVGQDVWLPVHFVTKVRASVLVWSRNSTDDETYSNYRREGLPLQSKGALPEKARAAVK
jgi:hypothetical protein